MLLCPSVTDSRSQLEPLVLREQFLRGSSSGVPLATHAVLEERCPFDCRGWGLVTGSWRGDRAFADPSPSGPATPGPKGQLSSSTSEAATFHRVIQPLDTASEVLQPGLGSWWGNRLDGWEW